MNNRTIKIVAIDNHLENLFALKASILNVFSEATVLTALEGKLGIELAAHEAPDLIFIDITASGINGFEICAQLKRDKKLRDIPVVLVSTNPVDKENRIKALESGAEATLSKPIDEIELTALIRAMLKIRAANTQKRDENQELKELKVKIQQLTDALKSEQSLMEAILNSLPGYFYVYDENGKLIKWNKNHETITGYTSEELSRMTLEKWFGQEDIPQVNDAVQAVFNNGYGEVEANLILKSGEKLMIRSSGAPLILDGHKYFAGIGVDITEQKRIEYEIKQSAKYNRTIIETTRDGFWVVDINGQITDVNAAYCQMTGYTKKELLGVKIEVLDVIETPQETQRHIKEIIENGSALFETRHKKKDGTLLDIEISATFVDRTTGIFAFCRDITQRVEAENALKASEERYRLIAENVSDVISVYNLSKGRFTYVSPSIVTLRGFTVEEAIRESFEEAISLNSLELTSAAMSKNLEDFLNNPKTLNSYLDKVEQPCKNGENIWVEIASKYRYNLENELEAISISRNIDARQSAEEQLKASEKELKDQNNLISTLLKLLPIGVFMVEVPSGKPLVANETAKTILGRGILPDVTKQNLGEVYQAYKSDSGERYPLDEMPIILGMQGISSHIEDMMVKDPSGINRHLEVFGTSVEDENKNVWASMVSFIDISERKKAQEMMIHLSYYDQLTNLYNRRFYEEELKRLDTERNLPITLIMTDVNGLKLTNDAFGHQAGDNLLKEIAQILKNGCRADEIISRIGGDEFVIIVPKSDAMQARVLIDRLNAALLEGKETNPILSLSIGYAVKETTSQNMNDIFKEAEDDMYRHKISESLSMRSKTIDLIMNSLFEKSNRERHHSDRVGRICEAIATHMNFDQTDIQQIKIAGRLHDIGKIGVSDNILNKKGKLDVNEWGEMKKHSEIGYRILSPVYEFSEISQYVLSHQERWDGKGYPQNLKGEAIPIQARIIAVADAFDAMTEQRAYRNVMSETEAIAEIRKCAGTQFDPEVVSIFIEKVMNSHELR